MIMDQEERDRALSRLGGHGLRRAFRKGAFLFLAGEASRDFYFLKSGEVRVFRADNQGREVEVARLKAGDFLGEAVALAGVAYPASAQAVRDTITLSFGRDAVVALAGRDPAIARFLVDLLARKCLVLNERVEALGLQTVRLRLSQYLLSHCSGDRGCLIELRLKKADLARLLGTVPETLSRTLKQLEREGLIEVQGARITVKNCAGLRAGLSC
jgi:CRP/FNR family transcriptional regulator, dissimilatory nitrate respiration regulator